MQIKSAEFIKGIRGTDNILNEQKMQVAFVGRSNVGKSSLMNCLLNRVDLVKSGKLPGKTKEINFFLVNDKFYFVDLPGYGYAKLPLETREQLAKMIQWYLQQEVFKRKVVIVLDIKAGPNEMDLEILRIVQESGQEVIVVANKADKLNQHKQSEQLKMISAKMPGIIIIPCSATTRLGREEILKKITA
ncbi:MAG: ribosome biogenesis GTP-binding protein YihA/YsxC [bacterium]|nr:ribosome biogenesis GTP-binding protein YihA/YsxC [bacterium]